MQESCSLFAISKLLVSKSFKSNVILAKIRVTGECISGLLEGILRVTNSLNNNNNSNNNRQNTLSD